MLTQLLDVFSFLSVLLRGSALALQSLIIGGAIFSFWILRPVKAKWGPQAQSIVHSTRRLIFCSAVALAVVQTCYVAIDSILLMETTGLSWSDITGAHFFIAGATSIVAALVAAAITVRHAWAPTSSLLAPSLLILISLVATSHAAGRVEGRTGLLIAGAMHMLAAASWIGTLAFFVLALSRAPDHRIGQWLCRRFSTLAVFSVVVVAAAGLMLSRTYIDSPEALYGTSYGVMVTSKVILFLTLLLLGGLNFLIVRRISTASPEAVVRLRRFAEVEVGIGFTVILAAASLSSQPPAADLKVDRVSLPEIVQRMTPRWPGFSTPSVASLSPATPLGVDNVTSGFGGLQSFVPGASYQPNTPSDIAWSEYNHHWAGIIVFAVGILALAARFPALRLARHWPLAFLGLAVFLFLRADPENWPLGPRSFWQSFAVAEVLQHRFFVLLIIAFAVFEWGVATQRVSSARAALVFPGVCAAGGALLLTHAHPLGNIREEFLAELSHVPLAICAVFAGWARWLELRSSGRPARVVTWIWPVCFVLIGALLLNYRES